MARFANRLALLKSYLLRKSKVDGYPVTVTLESTAKCNLYCPMCPREEYYFAPRDMRFDLFRKIVDEGKDHLEFVVPYGIGEPLLNPALFEMIKHCKSHGLKTGISTNATLLDEERSRKLIESGLDYIIFAFDGATPEVYEKYRRGAKFDKVRANILNFLRIKLELKADIYCIVQMVRLRENQHQIKDFIKMWSIPGIDSVRIKEDEVRLGDTAVENGKSAGPPRNPCHLLWRGPMYVRYDGLVWPCCYSYKSKPIGDLKQKTLAEVWNSPEMVKLRQAHISGKLDGYPDCQHCLAPKPRLLFILGTFVFDALRVRKLMPLFEKLSLLHRFSIFEN